MTAQPIWSPIDDNAADLLTLVADVEHPSVDFEWCTFTQALMSVAESNAGRIDQNNVRPLIRGRVAPKRIGAFYRRACCEGFIHGEGWSISTDTEGRNAGRPMRCYALGEEAS